MLSDLFTKRFSISVIVLFVFTYVFDLLVHGGTLPLTGLPAVHGDATVMVVGQLLMSIVVTYLFSQWHDHNGVSGGIRFGIPMGVLIGTVLMSGLDTLTIAGVLGLFVSTLFYTIIGGILLSVTYKK